VRCGSGLEINRYLDAYPARTAQVMDALSYFDTMNFADLVACPALVGLGARDEIVPAPTVYAIVNHLSCPHEVREFPVSHSSEPQEGLWSRFESEWLELARAGIPDAFGYRRPAVPVVAR
jgi:cephalosporin-C deacetylase-like acetyl esterase